MTLSSSLLKHEKHLFHFIYNLNLIKYSQVTNSIFQSLQELMGLKAYEVIRIPNSRLKYAYNQALVVRSEGQKLLTH